MVMLQEAVKELHADVGIAFDGDGDRVGVVNERGEIVPTDKLMIIFIRSIINTVQNKTFLYDVKCSKALEEDILALGGTPFICRTGASFTRATTLAECLPFGGEYSGHLFFNDRFLGFDSGIYCGLRLLEILSNSNKKVSELLDGVNNYYNTPEIKIPVSDDKKFMIVEKVKEYCQNKNYDTILLDGVRVNFSDGWALIRSSNTGPNLTVRYEAKTEKRLKEIESEFTNVLDKLIKK